MPCTPCWSTSSALQKASLIDVLLSQICNSLSLGIIINLSTFSLRRSIPLSALFIRGLPSKINGFVTTPTVRIPMSFAIFATTGAAPVPVPPPIPQVTNTISASFTSSVISSRFSSTAAAPISGFAPAPSPFVSFSPICTLVGALHKSRACLSVLIPINSTPSIASSTIRLTALLPAPPTPITRILACANSSFDIISNKVLLLLILCKYINSQISRMPRHSCYEMRIMQCMTYFFCASHI